VGPGAAQLCRRQKVATGGIGMAVQITTSATGRVAVVALDGEQDLATAEELRRTLVELCSRVPLIVVDFQRTTFVDSTVIGVVVGAWKRAQRHGHQVVGINAVGSVSKALHLTGVDALLQVSERVAAPDPTTLEQELSELLLSGGQQH
jgi:anti-anti-sigma factor